MRPLGRLLAAAIAMLIVGSLLFFMASDIATFIADRAFQALVHVPREWLQVLCHLLIAAVVVAPIAAISQRSAAWFGAATAVVGDIWMLYFWLKSESPRANFTENYFLVNGSFVLFLALVSHAWWQYVFEPRTRENEG